MSEGPAVLDTARSRWLAARREIVTASDAAAILGEDPRRGPLAVYAEKIGAISQADEDWLAFGRDVEGAVAKAYGRRTGRPVYDLGAFEIQRHPALPWLGATLDRLTEGTAELPAPAADPGPLEAKALAWMRAEDFEREPPIAYQIQLQVQMACTGAAWGSIVALIGGIRVAWKDIARDDAFLAAALPRLEEFHLRVRRGLPPEETDGREATSRAIRKLYSDTDGATLPLDHAALAMADRLDTLDANIKRDEDEAQAIENVLRRRMGAAAYGALPDGTFLALKVTRRKAYTRKVEAGTYRALTRFRPRLLPRRKA